MLVSGAQMRWIGVSRFLACFSLCQLHSQVSTLLTCSKGVFMKQHSRSFIDIEWTLDIYKWSKGLQLSPNWDLGSPCVSVHVICTFVFFYFFFFFWLKEGFCYKALGDGQGEEASRGAMSPTWPKKQFLNLCEKHNYKRRCNQCSTVWVHQGHDSFEMLPGGNVNAR